MDLWHRLDEEKVEGLKVVELTTEGLPTEILGFLGEEKLEGMFNDFYYNVDHLKSLLEVQFVPVVFYLNDDFTIVNISNSAATKEEMEQIVKDIPYMK